MTDSGLPPTPIHVLRLPAAVLGKTSCPSSGGRRLPDQTIGPSSRSAANRSSFSLNSSSYWPRSKPNSGNDSVNEPRPRMTSARPLESASSVANRS